MVHGNSEDPTMRFRARSRSAPAAGDGALIRRMLGLAWHYRRGCFQALGLQALLLVFALSGLGLMGLGVDIIRYHLPGAAIPKPPRWPCGWTPPAQWPPLQLIALVAAAILAFGLVRALLNLCYTLTVTRLVQAQIVVDLRARVYDKLQRLSFRFFDANASSSLINRVTGDVQSLRMFVDGVVIESVILLLSLAVYLTYMLRIRAGLTLACLATTPLLWAATRRFSQRVQPAYLESRGLFDRLIQVLSENIQGIHVILGFARQKEEIENFARANGGVRDQKRGIFRKVSAFQPLLGFLTQINLVVMLAYGGYLVVCYERTADPAAAARAGLSVGQLLVFAGQLQQFSGQVTNLTNVANCMQQSLIGARRVFEILDAPVEIRAPDRPLRLDRPRGEVRFERVSFAYQADDPILRDIDFRVEPGECVAILGPTGSGKSTLLGLIPRFYDPTAGRVLVDGADLKALSLEDLRRRIGLVFQESFLFSHTVAANIAFGHPEATRAQIERAARIAAAHDFVAALPQGYDTVLREGGVNLSGGQRQRLAIARALLLEPAILLLDDPTAAVDSATEHEILEAVERAMAGRTTFIVTHRLSALRRADRILVLNRGRIVQSGAHEELISAKGDYLWVAQLQAPDEESCRLLGEELDTWKL